MTTIELLNTLTADQFTETLNGIFEHSPWIPRKTFPKTPFDSWESLYSALCTTVDEAPESQQMDLITAHPDLAGKLAVANQLTEHSTGEQQSARLDQLSPERFESMQTMNTRYKEKFGFPFIICVKDHTQDSIFENFAARLQHEIYDEKFAALEQIKRIAWHRLHATVAE
ncbi:MAG: 2-oxo-4-hydroxy-4-carboxy-5-ureidoimidazoline decarboxylase [Verrucomicrobiota bacterium]